MTRHHHPTRECNGPNCREQIAFVQTKAGKSMPINAESLSDEDVEILSRIGEQIDYRHGDHVPHHSTCCDVESFRRPR